MAIDRGAVRAVVWQDAIPALRVFAALRLALNFKCLVLAGLGAAGMVAGWRLLGQLFHDPDHLALSRNIETFNVWPWDSPHKVPTTGILASLREWWNHNPLSGAWLELSSPFILLFQRPTFAHAMYLLCCGLWNLLIWSFFGGAICRQAAVGFARHENVSLGQMARFVHPRWHSYFVAPLFPLLGVTLIAALMALVGLIIRSDVGLAIASVVLWPLMLVGGFMMAFLLLGLFFSFPLMWAAISTEGTDSFGALSHAYSYSYQRPLQYLLYAAVAGLAGVLGWLLVTVFSDWILILVDWGVTWGSRPERLDQIYTVQTVETLGDAGAKAVQFWSNVLKTLAFGFVFSYFWSASTVIYFLLRKQVDATQLDEVYMPDEQVPHGLPVLKQGADGVPVAGDQLAMATSDEAEDD